MRSQLVLDVFFFSVLILLCLTSFTKANNEGTKNRRAANAPMGLIAFPRVGRRDPGLRNDGMEDVDEKYLQYAIQSEDFSNMAGTGEKRSALWNQPRVGRNDMNMFDTHRVSRTAQSMFNTPRTGRSDPEMQKYIKLMALERLLEKRTGSSATTGMWFGPRLGKRYSQVSAAATAPPLQSGQEEDY